MIKMNELFGGNIITSYSRADMFDDGTLIDVTSTAKEMGFSVPVALTYAVWYGTIQPFEGRDKPIEIRKMGALWDCLWLLYIGLKHNRCDTSEFLFPVILDTMGSDTIVILKAVMGSGDEGEPVITIMEREEE
jgi:hypothetical protein